MGLTAAEYANAKIAASAALADYEANKRFLDLAFRREVPAFRAKAAAALCRYRRARRVLRGAA